MNFKQGGGLARDGYVTDDLFFAVTLAYLYGFDSILKIDATISSRILFTLDIESEDCKILAGDFERGDVSVQPKVFCQIYSRVTKKLRDIQRMDDGIWTSPAWINGRGA